MQDDKILANTLNNFSSTAVERLDIIGYETETIIDKSLDMVGNAIYEFKDHPSILKIKNKFENNSTFSFRPGSEIDIDDRINKLSLKNRLLLRISPQNYLFCSHLYLFTKKVKKQLKKITDLKTNIGTKYVHSDVNE